MEELEVEICESSRSNFSPDNQGRWIEIGDSGDERTSIAGQQVVVRTSNDGEISIECLGLCAAGFDSIEHAKLSARSFTASVLDILGGMVGEDETVEEVPEQAQ